MKRQYKNNPVLTVNGKSYLMMPMKEFFERLIPNGGVRSCDNEIEDARQSKITEHITQDFIENNNLESSYWKFRKELNEDLFKNFEYSKSWCSKLLNLLPKNACFPFDLQQFAKDVEQSYRRFPESIQNDTYFLALFLPKE